MRERLLPAVAFTAAAAVAGCGFAGEADPEARWADESKNILEDTFGGQEYLDVNLAGTEGDYTVEVTINPSEIEPISPEVSERVRGAIVRIIGSGGAHAYSGTGFLYYSESLDMTMVLSAAHVFEGMEPGSISLTLDNGEQLQYETVTSYLNEDFRQTGDDSGWDDLAYIQFTGSESYRDRALTPGDAAQDPIEVGEQLYTAGYQEDHMPGSPAEFSLLYTHHMTNPRLGKAIGDVVLGLEEDSSEFGNSGSPIVDMQGNVEGMTVMNEPDEELPHCGENASNASLELNGRSVPVELVVPSESNDECTDGLDVTVLRRTEGVLGFVPRTELEPVHITNPSLG